MKHLHGLAVLAIAGVASLAACGDDETSAGATTGNATSGGNTTGTGTGTTAGTGTTTSATGTGGSGTTTTTTGTGGSGGEGTTGSTGTTGAGGGAGGSAPADHLVISEIGVAPAGGEFLEIYNPTAAAVDLGDYYLSDNSTYHLVSTGAPWMPVKGPNSLGTDFLVQFPAGTTLAADAVLVIALDAAYLPEHGCPDFIIDPIPLDCGGGETAAAMVVPVGGGQTPVSGFSNGREMLVLFHWDGTLDAPVEDADYVTWGTEFEAGSRADKTGVAGYAADTAVASQKPAPAPGATQSIERCQLESGETASGGNGITGHDETSEDLGASFTVQAVPTPGIKNSCL